MASKISLKRGQATSFNMHTIYMSLSTGELLSNLADESVSPSASTDPGQIARVRQAGSLLFGASRRKGPGDRPGFSARCFLAGFSPIRAHSPLPGAPTTPGDIWMRLCHGGIPPGSTYAWSCPALSLKPPAVICHHNLQTPALKARED